MDIDILLDRAGKLPEYCLQMAEPTQPPRDDDERLGEVPPEARRLFAIAFLCLSSHYSLLSREEGLAPQRWGMEFKRAAWQIVHRELGADPEIIPFLRIRQGWVVVRASTVD